MRILTEEAKRDRQCVCVCVCVSGEERARRVKKAATSYSDCKGCRERK